MSSRGIGVFVATMTGTAELCAEEVATVLAADGHTVETLMMDGLGAEAIAPFGLVVIISSTYGHGDIPDNGQAFFDAVSTCGSLAGTRFAVFGLGDRTFAATFCEAGRKWDALFARKGAHRIAALMQHDASGGTLAEDEAAGWAASLIPLLRQAA